CFSMPLYVVYRHGSRAFPSYSAAVSASVRHRGGMPAVLGGMSVAGGLQVPTVWEWPRLPRGKTKALAVRRLPSSGVSDIGNRSSQHEDPADRLVLGGVPDDD